MSEAASRTAPVPTRVPRWLWVVLIVSLAVNFLVAGAILRFAWSGRGGPALSAFNALRYTDSLPGDRADQVRGAMKIDRNTIRQIRGELRAAQRDAVEILTAETFDKPRFIAAQNRIAELEARLRQELRSVVPDLAERMSQSERRELVRWREGRRGDHDGRWRGGEDRRRD